MTVTGNKTVVIVGGGLSGMVAAFQARQLLGHNARIIVLEASPRIGGILHTEPTAGGPIELGAEAFVARRPEAIELVTELGLKHHLVSPSPLRPAILTGGSLVPMPPATLMGIPSRAADLAGVLDKDAVITAAAEEYQRLDWVRGSDCSAGAFLSERFGSGVVTRLVDPMLGGVYACPSSELSLREVVPGLALALDEGAPSVTAAVRGRLSKATPGTVFQTLAGGYGELIAALQRFSAAEVHLSAKVTAIAATSTGWRVCVSTAGPIAGATVSVGQRSTVSAARKVLDCSGVVLALPAHVAATVLSAAKTEVSPSSSLDSAPGLSSMSELLSSVRTASSAVVAMRLGPSMKLPEFSGVLVATDEPVAYKAITMSSNKWPHLKHPAGPVVRVSFGRLGADEVLAHNDPELAEIAERSLAELFDQDPESSFTRVRRWERSLAVIAPEHAKWRNELQAAEENSPGIVVTGAAIDGVGVPACIGAARAAVRRLVEQWQD